MYITKPPAHKKRPDVAILYLTDVFGIPLVQNKLYVPSKPSPSKDNTTANRKHSLVPGW